LGNREYGDEAAIYEMAIMESRRKEAEIPNDIKNGYVIIDDKHIPFSERNIIEGKLYMTIPEGFVLMPLEAAEVKYPNKNRPTIIYTNETGSVTVNFSLTPDELDNEDVEDACEYLQQVITKMHPSSEIISSTVIEGDARIGIFDFVIPALDDEIYNLMFIFPLDGQFILGTFNCSHSEMAGWQDIANQMIQSIRIVQDKRGH